MFVDVGSNFFYHFGSKNRPRKRSGTKRSTLDFEQPANENHVVSFRGMPGDTQNHSQNPSQKSIRFCRDFQVPKSETHLKQNTTNRSQNAYNKSNTILNKQTEINPQCTPKRSPVETQRHPTSLTGAPGTPPRHPGGVQGDSGDSCGALGFPQGAPEAKTTPKGNQMCKKLRKTVLK